MPAINIESLVVQSVITKQPVNPFNVVLRGNRPADIAAQFGKRELLSIKQPLKTIDVFDVNSGIDF